MSTSDIFWIVVGLALIVGVALAQSKGYLRHTPRKNSFRPRRPGDPDSTSTRKR